MQLYPYGLCAGAGITAFIAACLLLVRNRALRLNLLGASGFGFVCGLVCSRLVWCAANYADYIYSPAGDVFNLTKGGLSLFGAFAGYSACLCVWAKLRRVNARSLFDAAAPGFMLFTFAVRAGEFFTELALGVGKVTTLSALAGTVFTVEGWGEVRFAVYRYEAALALVMFAVAAFMLVKGKRHVFTVAFGGLCAFQTVFESLRDDYHMNIHYVRVSQVISILTLLTLVLVYTVSAVRKSGFSVKGALPAFITVCALALVVKQEFTVDTALDLEFQYLIMLAGALTAYSAVLWSAFTAPCAEAAEPAGPGRGALAASLLIAAAVAAVCALCVSSGSFYWGL